MISPSEYLIQTILPRLGLEFFVEFTVEGKGWNIVLPNIKFNYDTFVVLNFVNPFTIIDGRVIELEKIEFYYSDYNHRIIVLHNDLNIESKFSGNIKLININSSLLQTVESVHSDNEYWNFIFNCPKLRNYQVNLVDPSRTDLLDTALDILDHKTVTDFRDPAKVNIINHSSYKSHGLIDNQVYLSMLIQQIPIVIGHQGLVNDLSSCGFDMFGDLVNLDYDYASDDDRIQLAIESNKDIITGKIDLTPYQERLSAQKKFVLDQATSMYVNVANDFISKLNSFQEIDLDLRII